MLHLHCLRESGLTVMLFQILMNFMACLGSIAIGTIYAYPAVALARWEDANLKYTTAQTTWFGESFS